MSQCQEITKRIAEADTVVIGASNGFSITEGIDLFADNNSFEELFGDIKNHHGITCLLQGIDQIARRAFGDDKVAWIQGDFGWLQCGHRCTDEVYPSREIYKKIQAAVLELRLRLEG